MLRLDVSVLAGRCWAVNRFWGPSAPVSARGRSDLISMVRGSGAARPQRGSQTTSGMSLSVFA